jgi:hypothetical protein
MFLKKRNQKMNSEVGRQNFRNVVHGIESKSIKERILL